MKRKIALLMALLCLTIVLLPGCKEDKGQSSSRRDTQKTADKMEETTGLKTVSILVDLADGTAEEITKTLNKVPGFGEDFIYQIEVLPPLFQKQDRDNIMTRVRTEIMAGKGPDLFLCSHRLYGYNAGPDDMPFFKFPVQAMSNRIFLPLDDYIEEAGNIDWDSMQPVVMEAGRNQEGQQIVPLSYTFETAIFDGSYTPEAKFPMTWQQMTEDPDPNIRAASYGHMYNIIGELADYSKDAPAFTEEELLGWVTKQYDIWQTVPKEYRDVKCIMMDQGYLSDLDENFSLGGKEEYTMIPLCNISGGVTANITTFAAINRNARYPDEAFKVIEYLLDPEVQQTSTLFQFCTQGLPVYTGTGNSDTPSGSRWQMNEANYKAVTEIQEMINVANFPGPVDAGVWGVMGYDEEEIGP
jgi:ABC-type glycerol-3-phosphate transport system substrate-binding protein